MHREQSSLYLRLGQFLELERRWLDARDKAELCHRICRTTAILLDTPTVALSKGGDAEPVVREGRWQGTAAGTLAALVGQAESSGTAQIKSIGDTSIGVFPFPMGGGDRGYLHVRIERPLFTGVEVAFLTFLATLTGLLLAGGWAADRGDAALTVSEPSQSVDDLVRRRTAMAAHDMRNPLDILSRSAELLIGEDLGELNSEQRLTAAAMRRQIQFLASEVDRVVELGRFPSQDSTNKATTFPLSELFTELRETRFPDSASRLRWPGPEAAFEFSTNRHHLLSILQNLLDNALKHGVDPVTVECTRRNGCLVVEVTDCGPGMDRELAERVERLAVGDIALAAGTGMGLSTMADYLKSLGGKVSIVFRESTGMTVCVRIPRARQ